MSVFHPIATFRPNVCFRSIADITFEGHDAAVTDRKFYPNQNKEKPPLATRQLWRLETAAGQLIAFETMEEVFFETHRPPYREWSKLLPISG